MRCGSVRANQDSEEVTLVQNVYETRTHLDIAKGKYSKEVKYNRSQVCYILVRHDIHNVRKIEI